MTRTGKDATDWAKAHAHTGGWYRNCLSFVRQSFGRPGGVANAGLAWDRAKYKHRTNDGNTIPAGVPVFWETSGVADHIAISVGGGLCRSTDAVRRGNADIVGINTLTRKWGMDLQGWTEDLNGARVYHAGPSKPIIDLSNVVYATKHGSKITFGAKLKRAVAAEVGKGGMSLQTNGLGPDYKAQYRLVQRKYLMSIGHKPGPGDDDGVAGLSSLQWLGSRHGFDVRG